MLILARRVGETIMIGDDVSATVLGVKGNQVRIGIEGPKEVPIHRLEIYDKILLKKSDDAKNKEVAVHRSEIFEKIKNVEVEWRE